jgi:urease accessory protein
MSANVFLSEVANCATLPASIRAEGRLALAAERAGARTIARRIAEAGPLRVRFPRIIAGGRLEAVLINTAGGIVGGDRLRYEVEAGEGAELCVTSQAAEKVYRSSGDLTELSIRLRAEKNAKLAWLPQETILFDRVKIARALDAEIAKDASVTICESVVFGRTAMGERVVSGAFSDRWRIRRNGRLIFADTFKLAGEIGVILARGAVADNACAVATLLQVAPEAETKIDHVRAVSAEAVEFGVSAFDGLIVVRMVARESLALRRAILSMLHAFGAPPPRAFTL